MPRFHTTRPRFIRSRRLLETLGCILVFSSLLMATQSLALTLKVGWQPSPDARVAGYKLFYGQSTRSYSNAVDAGGQVSCTLSDLYPGSTYFFAAAAYDASGNQSDYSEEISYTVPHVADNGAPIAVDGRLGLTEEGEGSGTLQADDPDGDDLTFSIVTPPARGTVTLIDASSGTFRYVPYPNAFGTDSFLFKASDSQRESNTATMVLSIGPSDDPPVAAADAAVTTRRTPIVINVLSNDTDADGDSLFIKSVQRGQNGRIRVIGKTTIQYTPRKRFTGTDIFTYTISDGRLDSSPAAVVVQVLAANTPPGTSVSIDLGTADPVVLALNAGGPAYVDSQGIHYEADRFHSGGSAHQSRAVINGTPDETLYRSERRGEFSYDIPLENGHYLMTLKLAEITCKASGRRVMDVTAEGREIVSDLDLYGAAGRNHAYDIRVPVKVSDGTLNIGFRADVNKAKLNALLIQKLEHGLSYAVNAGGRRFVDAAGVVYEHDAFGAGGQTHTVPSSEEGTENHDLLGTRRSGDFLYDIPLPDGAYLVTLKFAELSVERGREHLFHLKVQDEDVLSSFDTTSVTGSGSPWEIPCLAVVRDGHLRLSVQSPGEKAQLSAILIEWQE